MKSLAVFALVLLLPVGSSLAEDKWFDMATCSICKPMAEHPELMESMKWEIHVVENGMIEIASMPPEVKEKMAACHKQMKETIQQIENGANLPCCGFCKSYGSLKMAGANIEEIDGGVGMIALVTSDDPEVIKKIHAHAKKTQEEYKKMLAAK